MALLRASDLGMRFATRWLFRHLELELGAGDVLAITGPNGCGKSTLLRILAGLLAPIEGSVARARKDPRQAVGYAALDLHLYPALTAREHLEFAAATRGGSLLESDRLFGEIAPFADAPAGQLSTGMRARLKLALAMAHRPPVLALDEPTAALDAPGRTLVEELVELQKSEGAMVVATNRHEDLRWATHELSLA